MQDDYKDTISAFLFSVILAVFAALLLMIRKTMFDRPVDIDFGNKKKEQKQNNLSVLPMHRRTCSSFAFSKIHCLVPENAEDVARKQKARQERRDREHERIRLETATREARRGKELLDYLSEVAKVLRESEQSKNKATPPSSVSTAPSCKL